MFPQSMPRNRLLKPLITNERINMIDAKSRLLSSENYVTFPSNIITILKTR